MALFVCNCSTVQDLHRVNHLKTNRNTDLKTTGTNVVENMSSFVIVQINQLCWALNPSKNIWIIPCLIQKKKLAKMVYLVLTGLGQFIAALQVTLSPLCQRLNTITLALKDKENSEPMMHCVMYLKIRPGYLEHWQGVIVEVVHQLYSKFHPEAMFEMTQMGCINQSMKCSTNSRWAPKYAPNPSARAAGRLAVKPQRKLQRAFCVAV